MESQFRVLLDQMCEDRLAIFADLVLRDLQEQGGPCPANLAAAREEASERQRLSHLQAQIDHP